MELFFTGIVVLFGLAVFPRFTLSCLLIYYGHEVMGLIGLILTLLNSED